MAFPSSVSTLVQPDPDDLVVVDHAENHSAVAVDLMAVETKLGSGSATPARSKQLVGNGSGTSTWDTVQRKQRLINGSFRVKQRNTLGSTDDTYIHDRWTLLLEAANAAAASAEASDFPSDGANAALKLTVGSGEDNKFGVVTFLEAADCKDLRGKVVSLQAKIKVTAAITDVRMAVLEWASTADVLTSDVVGTWGSAGTNPTLATNWAYVGTPANLSPTTSWATYRVESLTLSSSFNNLAVVIWCEDETTTVTTDIMRVTDVQLEEGAVCTDVERPRYEQELAACEFWLQSIGGSAGVAPFYVLGGNTSTTLADYGPIVRRRMRAAPSVTVTVGDWTVTELGAQVVTTNLAIVSGYAAPDGIWLRATVAAGLTAGRAVALAPYLSGNFTQILLSAEL